jgi:MEMO1 family protein
MAVEKIRESVIAGSWYPDHPETLREEINKHLNAAQPPYPGGELVALIAPHAGYLYSGGVAAYAYKLLQNQPFDRVIIVAPSHRAHFKGASIYSLGGYRTPLGIVPLDQELVDAFLEHPSIVSYVPQADAQEHSLEIQLPFLQVVLSDFRLTPIIMGDQSFEFCQKLADLIVSICSDKRVLLVASTDLSHFHSYQEAKTLDKIVLDKVAYFDPGGLSKELRTGGCEACGGGPIMTVMLAAEKMGAGRAKVLHYANSGDVTGDRSGVVGYMAAAFVREETDVKAALPFKKAKVGVDLGLSPEEKKTLKELAFNAIRNQCHGNPIEELHDVTDRLKEHRGAFVCLKIRGALRGCIGMIEARAPLHETVKDMAVQAAFGDPRFCALSPPELERIDLELSVLTPLERISDESEIEIGKHGLYIRKGRYSGLLLPQVATENHWDRKEFLEWTCRKAGLSANAWKSEDAEIYRFSADVF